MPPPAEQKTGAVLDGLRREAFRLGFSAIGVTTAQPPAEAAARLTGWLAKGYDGTMAYMGRGLDRRSDPGLILSGARTVICLAHPYYPGEFPPSDRDMIKISRYAWGRDYHNVLAKKLTALERYLAESLSGIRTRRYADTGPIMEKALAEQAGLGFIGKNTLLITPTAGSWVFLAEILTTHDFPVNSPSVFKGCGTCRLCLDACPTGALRAPFELDARRCLSYLTIENRGPIPAEMIHGLSGWGFGCDICQEVCPYNRGVEPTSETRFHPAAGAGPYIDPFDPGLLSDDETFCSRYNGTPLMRAKRVGMQRNVSACLDDRGNFARPGIFRDDPIPR